MTKVTAIKTTAVTVLLLAAAFVSLLFVFVIGGEEGGKKIGSLPVPGISMGLTAEAMASLRGWCSADCSQRGNPGCGPDQPVHPGP